VHRVRVPDGGSPDRAVASRVVKQFLDAIQSGASGDDIAALPLP
jgi:hypothetical protein